MIIKRSSWYYKLSNLGDFEKRNDNLCNYFWRIVGKSALFFVVVMIFSVLGYKYFTNPDVVFNTLVLLWLLATCALPPLAIYSLRQKIGKPPEAPGENIVKEFIKTKKNKLCPFIEYIN